MLDTETRELIELIERRPEHENGEARSLYDSLQGPVPLVTANPAAFDPPCVPCPPW